MGFTFQKTIPFLIQGVVWIPAAILFYFFGKLEIRGIQNLVSLKNWKGGIILAPNHSHELDSLLIRIVFSAMGRFTPLFYVSRDKTFYDESGWMRIFYGGFFFKLMGAYPTYSGLKNYEKALKDHVKILFLGGSICIFPEGKITKNGDINEAKGGVAFLAHRTNTPVIPIGISGLFNMSIKDFIFRRKKVIISFGKPLLPKDIFANVNNITPNDYKEGAELIMKRVKSLIV